MPDGKVYSETQLEKIFLEIGRSKESVAAGMIQQQKAEEQQRLNTLKGRLGMLSGSDGIEGDDETIAAEMRRIEEEIAKVQAGEAHRYEQTDNENEAKDQALQETDCPDVFEKMSAQSADAPIAPLGGEDNQSPTPELDVDDLLQELGVELSGNASDAFSITEEVLGTSSTTTPEDMSETMISDDDPDFELLGGDDTPVTHVFFAMAENAANDTGAYSYRFVGQRVILTSAKSVSGDTKQVFCVALERLLQDIKDSNLHVVQIYMSTENSKQLFSLMPELSSEEEKIVNLLQEMQDEYAVQVVSNDSENVAHEVITAKSLLFDNP